MSQSNRRARSGGGASGMTQVVTKESPVIDIRDVRLAGDGVVHCDPVQAKRCRVGAEFGSRRLGYGCDTGSSRSPLRD